MMSDEEYARMRAEHDDLVAFVESNRARYLAEMESWSAVEVKRGNRLLYGLSVLSFVMFVPYFIPAGIAFVAGEYVLGAPLLLIAATGLFVSIGAFREARRD